MLAFQIISITNWKFVFFEIPIFIHLYQIIKFHVMNKEKIAKQMYNLLENTCRLFPHVVFPEVSKPNDIISNDFKIKKLRALERKY